MIDEPLPNTLAKGELVGWIREIESRTTGSGKAVANVAINCGKYGTFRVTAWEDEVERIASYGVGAQIIAECRLQRRSYEDKEGKTVWTTDLTVNHITLLTPAPVEEAPAF